MNRRATALVTLAALSTFACSNDPAETSPTTTLATTATSVAATTTSTTDATTTATATPTTQPPPTTTTTTTHPGNIEQVRADVAAALVASWKASDDFLQDPTNPEASAKLRSLMTEQAYRNFVDAGVTKYIINNLAERPNPSWPASMNPHPETLIYDPALGTASMEYCFASTNLLVLIEPDGTEILQDDRIGIALGTSTLELVDGEWLESGGSTAQVIEGEGRCPDR